MIAKLGDVDFSKKSVKPQVFLCKPNKVVVSKLSEAYEVKFNPKLGALNELTFTLPVFFEKHHEVIRNENADIIRGRYLIKFLLGSHEEYFMITQVDKIGSDSGEELNITTLSLGLEMNDKIIRDYTAVSKTATELLEDLLVDTIWTVGYVDSEFDLKYRGLEVSSNTVLELVFEVATTFNALVEWDTLTRQIHLRKPDLVGRSKGFKIKYGKYMEGLNVEDNTEEIVTRLKVYGKDNITIREVNPTGTVFIEDYSYFVYPYKEESDGNGGYNVISHSDYMSDELCHHILMYDKLLEENNSKFTEYIAKRSALYDVLDVKSNEKDALIAGLNILLDDRDVLNTRIAKMRDMISNASNNFEDTILLQSDHDSLVVLLNSKLIEIEAKRAEVSSKEAEVIIADDNVQQILNDINILKDLLAIENNFSFELLSERNPYEIQKEWIDDNIDNAEDLLVEGKVAFDELKKEKTTLKVDVVNFLSMLTEQRNWDKLGLGDTIKIEHERLGVEYDAKITEIEYDFEDASISLTISNVKDIANADKLLEMLYKGYGSSTTISIDKWKWDLSLENNGSINQIINNKWDANKQAIIGAKDQVVELSDRGLIIRDPNDPNVYLVGINGLIAITNDGGNTWKHAISKDGIVGEYIYGKIYMGVNLALEDEDGVVKWQGSKGEIFDRNGVLVMKMGLVDEDPDVFGLWSFNDTTRVKIDSTEGFVIERANSDLTTYPSGWEKIMWANQNDGTLYTHDLVAQNIKIVNNIGDVILDAENNYFDIGDFQTIVMDNKLTTIEKMQIITELYKIESGYHRMIEQANQYIRSTRDDVFDIESQFFSKSSSTTDLYSTTPLSDAYVALVTYMSRYIKVTTVDPLSIDVNDPLTESTSDISDRAEFILKFKTYYDEEINLRNKIEDAQFYSGLNMGTFYNNVVIGNYGFIALRNDGKYRSILNATNGLALQKWEKNRWVNKVYASIGSDEYEDGTLIAEDLIAKRLRIETKAGDVLLDADALNFDFSVLNSIILDDVIVSTEKISLANQYKSITKQYITLKEQIFKYVNTIYNDRDSTYLDLDDARNVLETAGDELNSTFDALTSYMNPVFANMNTTTHIVTDLNSTRFLFHLQWENFYKAYENGRARLADFLEKSSLQLGRNYNNTVIDAENGIVVTRGNMMNKTTLNATEGIKIERNDGTASNPSWYKVFYVDLEGNLFAEDMSTKRLRILDAKLGDAIIFDWLDGITINGQNGEQIRLNANEGIAIDVDGDPRFWIHTDGTLRAKRLIVVSDDDVEPIELPDGSYVSKLAVSELRTINAIYEQDYIHIKENSFRFLTGTGAEDDMEKLSIMLEGASGHGTFATIKMGIGDTTLDNQIGYIRKDHEAFKLDYKATLGYKRRFWMTNEYGADKDGMILESQGANIKMITNHKIRLEVNANNYIEVSSSGVKIVGTRIDLN